MTQLSSSLQDSDPAIYDIIEREKNRQMTGLQLIPSENFTSKAVLEAVGSVMTNKYSEGYPGKRYYGGNEFIDMAESMCQSRALEVFGLDPDEWGVNVQTLSGSPSNMAVYTALLDTHDRILALDLPHGGHLSHGYRTDTKDISAVSKFFTTMPYRLDEETGFIDYDAMEATAALFRPKILIAGASAYSRIIDYDRMRKLADKHGCVLLADMAHISGLVAAGVMPSPFDSADVVTTTTHKSLRGPRGAMIFYRKGTRTYTLPNGKEKTITYDMEDKINAAVFPGLQGGPHNHTITALAVALKQAMAPEYKQYQVAVMENSTVLADEMVGHGYELVSGGTDNHLMLINLRPLKIDGGRVERVLEMCGIALNKNTVPGDVSALMPGGIRLGTPAITSRGFETQDMTTVGALLHEGIALALTIKERSLAANGGKAKLVDFIKQMEDPTSQAEMAALKAKVHKVCAAYPVVGFEAESMVYPM